jgi:serine/threonine protein phosphatase PrpC
MFLNTHYLDYNLSKRNLASSLLTGFSGISYASRHWELSQEVYTKKQVWGHRTIAVIEAIPAVGGLAALIERIIFAVNEKKFTPSLTSTPHSVESSETLVKKNQSPTVKPRKIQEIRELRNNSKKAILEHIEKAKPSHKACFATLQEGLPSTKELMIPPPTSPLSFKCEIAEFQGPRKFMEDSHFFIEDDEKILAGIFDGHGGKEVANYAKEEFEKNVNEFLIKFNYDIPLALTSLIDKIHEDVMKNSAWDSIGSTIVICHLNKLTNEVITVAIGDSEAIVYRVYLTDTIQQIKSIPLSCLRNWGCKEEAKRASKAMDDPKIAKTWPKSKNPKSLKFKKIINVSRAIGDKDLTGTVKKPGVIHTPEIGMNIVQSGDTLVLACDGLKDHSSEANIIMVLKGNPQNKAQKLLEIIKYLTKDNVTILAITIT